jgi:hypothetical protein
MRLFLAALILIVGAIPLGAQWLDRLTPGIPRTPDGKANLTAPAPRRGTQPPAAAVASRDATRLTFLSRSTIDPFSPACEIVCVIGRG